MENLKLVEQIASFKNMTKSEDMWRLAFYNLVKEFWESDEHYVVLDKSSYDLGYKLPLIREYKDVLGVQFFTDYSRAVSFVEKEKDLFVVDNKKLIYKIKKGAFQQVFVPFLAQQNLAYIINDIGEEFIDTFERLLAVMEAEINIIVNDEQALLLEKKDFKSFYADVCEKYLVYVG